MAGFVVFAAGVMFAAEGVMDAQAAGPPAMLAFTAPVASSTTTHSWSVSVAVEDSLKNVVVTDNTDRVALAIALGTGDPSAVLSCTSGDAAIVSSGVAQFTGCTINKPGPAYELTAASGALTQASSSIFNVFSPIPTQLALTQSPSDTSAGTVLAPQPTFTVEDRFGGVVADDKSTVTLSITGGTPVSGGPGSLTGCSQSETGGVVTFSGCMIATPGVGYKLHATDGSLTAVDTAPFTVNPVVSPRVIPQPSPAPSPPTVLKKLSVAVSGAGTVTGTSGIVCSGNSARCFGTFKPDTTLHLKAGARAGFHFVGWSGSCSGHAALCVISIKEDADVTATFAPLHPTSIVPVSIGKAAFAVTWAQSVGSGELTLGGTIGKPASVSITLHRAGRSTRLLTEHLQLPAGRFSVSLRLSPGKLAAGALLPGAYVILLDGKSGKGTILPQVKPVTLTAPTAGVVSKAYTSRSSHGPAAASVNGVNRIWVHFSYQTQPRGKAPITVAWYAPSGHLVGSIAEPNRPEVVSSVGVSSGTLPGGTWRADLRSGTTIVKSVTVNVT
jgi:hypothetical protein